MMPDVPAGESLQEIGRDGVQRAKVWLEKTGRVDVRFNRYDSCEAAFLGFKKLSGQEFSFDMSGVLRLDTGNVQFFGEVKKVSGEAGQGVMYPEYLAKCYRATVCHQTPYHFMWITWHPFSLNSWTQLCTAAQVKAAVAVHRTNYCETEEVDEQICSDLAERLWLIVLSDRQETLSMSDDMFRLLSGNIALRALQP
jgi:hypothetical protein